MDRPQLYAVTIAIQSLSARLCGFLNDMDAKTIENALLPFQPNSARALRMLSSGLRPLTHFTLHVSQLSHWLTAGLGGDGLSFPLGAGSRRSLSP
jgi:hypothetical protein